ncbi:F-box protein At5g07610-like [Lolium perenne]|uniref:F-box protein At5g07610-like n=1 Tax=Lolium perenne TaxID=4522 RepID=UPI0021EACAC9|nr:uncharacterized protein LOC127303451 [Lolium perenne]
MAPTFERLTENLHLDILSRVPAKSLCRFKCASKIWLRLVDHPAHSTRLPKSMAGFFCNSTISDDDDDDDERASPDQLSTSLMPPPEAAPLSSTPHRPPYCPTAAASISSTAATGSSSAAVLPDRVQDDKVVGTACLGFDPAAAPHFHVFLFSLDARRFISGVDVYSSQTGTWTYKVKRRGETLRLADHQSAVFLNGYLHLSTACAQRYPSILAVDTKGEEWRYFDTPCDMHGGDEFLGSIHQSQGRLHYASFNTTGDWDEVQIQLQVYALDDYATDEWILKHTLELSETDVHGGIIERKFDWIEMHPESNLIFFCEESDSTLKCYSMRSQEETELRTLGEGQPPYLPYVPLYTN